MKPAIDDALKLYDCIKPGHFDCVVKAITAARRDGADEMRETVLDAFADCPLPPADLLAVVAVIRSLPLKEG